MDDPVAEIRDVVRSVTVPIEGATLVANVEKYYTEDAVLQHPIMLVAGKQDIKGIYKLVRVNSIGQDIVFTSVMFNEDKTRVSIDMIEYMNFRRMLPSVPITIRLIVLLDLVKGEDGKYRISRQEDNFPSDTPFFAIASMPVVQYVFDVFRNIIGSTNAAMGNFLLSRGLLGP